MNTYGIFDIIGPVMIGPSSSHTAGAARIGNMAAQIFNRNVRQVVFYLHGSFYKTYRGHGTDKALLAGVMGIKSDDERIRDSYEIAHDRGIEFAFVEEDLGEVHPNTVKIVMSDGQDHQMEITGSSVGAGKIMITQIDATEVEVDGEYATIMTSHHDKPGVIAKICNILSVYNINIAFMKVFRHTRGDHARLVVQVDGNVSQHVLDAITVIDEVMETRFIKGLEG